METSFSDSASGIQLPDGSNLAINQKNDNDVTISQYDVIVNFFDVVLLLLSSFMSISSLVLELWQSSFITDRPEIQKSEVPRSGFCPISEDWDKLRIPNLTQILIKCYWILQNARFTTFTAFELLTETQQVGCGRGGINSPSLDPD